MMERRRWPSTAPASCSTPSPSGPRCVSAASMRRMPPAPMPGWSMRPAMPHMGSALPCSRAESGRRARPALAQHSLEDRLVALGAAVDEELLDGGEVMVADRIALLGRCRELADGRGECLEIIEPHEAAGRSRRKEVSLASAVVAHDGQLKGHGLEKHQAKALVLARRDEQVRGG